MIFGGFGRRKTKPIKAKQTQYYLAPRFIWGLKSYLKKQSQFATLTTKGAEQAPPNAHMKGETTMSAKHRKIRRVCKYRFCTRVLEISVRIERVCNKLHTLRFLGK